MEILSLQIQKFDEISLRSVRFARVSSFLAMTDWNGKQENGNQKFPNDSFQDLNFYTKQNVPKIRDVFVLFIDWTKNSLHEIVECFFFVFAFFGHFVDF